MVTDPVGDTLIRIKNGYLARREEVAVPFSKLVQALCELLMKEGYIEALEKQDKNISLKLKYSGREPVLTDVKRVSKPGLRVYKGVKDLPRVLDGLGIAVVSTPKGLMTDREARKEGVGGEIMALVW